MRDGRVDRVLGDVALGAEVVAARRVGRQRPPLHLHLVRRLPGAHDHFTHAAHGLRVGRHHGNGADVVQNVFRGDGFAADARLGKRHVFGNRRVQVVAHHQHVQVLVERVDGKRARRIGRRGQHVRLPHGGDDVGRMAAARSFRVKRVDGAVLEGGQRMLEKAPFVEGVAVQRHLDIHAVGHGQAVVDGGRRAAPVLVQFQADGARAHLLFQRQRQADVTFPHEAQVHREGVGGRQHGVQMPWPRRAGGGGRAHGRSRAAAQHGRHAAHQRFLDLLRADEVDVRVDAAGRDDQAFAGDDLGGAADGQGDAGLDVRVARLADAEDQAIFQADIGFHDAPVVEDDGIRDDGIHHLGRAALRLAHAVADHLAAAEFHFFAVDRIVMLDLDEQFRVGQADAVALGGAEHFGIRAAGNAGHLNPFPVECLAGRPSLRH